MSDAELNSYRHTSIFAKIIHYGYDREAKAFRL